MTIVRVLVAAFVIVLVAAAVQSTTGFGFSLVAVPLVTLAIDPRTAVVALAMPALVLAIGTAVADREHVRWRATLALLAAMAAGMPVGLLVLRAVNDRVLTVLIAVVVLASTALVWRNPQVPRHRGAIALAGLTAGVLSTTTGTTGPPLVAALHTMGYEPRTLRGTIATLFSFGGILSIAGFVVVGAMTRQTAVVGLVSLPAVLIGGWAGNILFSRIDGARFRQTVLVTLVVCCLLAVARTVKAL
jgi:uncharacterized membrane protein YfcA